MQLKGGRRSTVPMIPQVHETESQIKATDYTNPVLNPDECTGTTERRQVFIFQSSVNGESRKNQRNRINPDYD